MEHVSELSRIDASTANRERDDQPTPVRTVVLAEPRGFCAGVKRAIAMVERTLDV